MRIKRTRIKICGVRDVQTAAVAVNAGADAIGLVFVQASPRVVTATQARQIVRALPPFVEPVALFVDAPIDDIRKTTSDAGIRTVQLHGHETPDQIAQLEPLRVIKALAFDPQTLTARLKSWMTVRQHLAGLLLDAPAISPTPSMPGGGSGRPFDWDVLAQLKQSGALTDLPPWILAGGLTPDNVAQAMDRVGPYGVDVSSGVESSRGVKDHALIHSFCQSVHRADRKNTQ